MDQPDQARFRVAQQEYMDHRTAMAQDETFVPEFSKEVFKLPGAGETDSDLSVKVPSPPSPFFLDAWTLDQASELVRGLDNYYVCRYLDCRNFSPNSMWIEEEGKGHYKCTRCLRQYKPWAFIESADVRTAR